MGESKHCSQISSQRLFSIKKCVRLACLSFDFAFVDLLSTYSKSKQNETFVLVGKNLKNILKEALFVYVFSGLNLFD